jgi:predicted Zn finger-like uncharacterized protein
MDVRCDRCQTEYELDDASVTAEGATVQCTTCGHTFVVTREVSPAAAPPVLPGGTPGPMLGSSSSPTPSWMLTTEEGKTHRFRDSTTLQKWIVERRVTREDRVCPPGGAWHRLGDVEELRPFFDVVDQADRSAAAARARPTRPETPRSSRPPGPAYVSPDPDDGDVLTTGNSRRGPAIVDDDLDAAGVGGGARRGRILLILGALVVAGVVGYVSFKHTPGAPPAAAPPVASAPPAAPPAAAPPAAAPPAAPPAPPVAAAPSPAAAPAAPAPPPAAPAAAATPAAPAAPPRAPAAAPAAPAAAAPAPQPAGSHAPAAPAAERPRSYERLVADGDRALENGQTAKAQKLYDEALRMQPNGVAAMTGSAYVLLDRQKPLAAIDLFKRALGMSPGYSQALFGLGEAYRLEGQPIQAIAAYKHYLEASPGGADSPAARRQIRELESQAGAPASP